MTKSSAAGEIPAAGKPPCRQMRAPTAAAPVSKKTDGLPSSGLLSKTVIVSGILLSAPVVWTILKRRIGRTKISGSAALFAKMRNGPSKKSAGTITTSRAHSAAPTERGRNTANSPATGAAAVIFQNRAASMKRRPKKDPDARNDVLSTVPITGRTTNAALSNNRAFRARPVETPATEISNIGNASIRLHGIGVRTIGNDIPDSLTLPRVSTALTIGNAAARSIAASTMNAGRTPTVRSVPAALVTAMTIGTFTPAAVPKNGASPAGRVLTRNDPKKEISAMRKELPATSLPFPNRARGNSPVSPVSEKTANNKSKNAMPFSSQQKGQSYAGTN